MQLTVDQLLLLVHEKLAEYPASLAHNHARKKLGQAMNQIRASGMATAPVEIPVTERVVPTQDFGTSSPKPSDEKAEKDDAEDAPTEKKEPSRSPTRRRTRKTRAKKDSDD
jgi:hypothetical protein